MQKREKTCWGKEERLPRFIAIAIYLFLWERARRSVTQNREIQDIGMRGQSFFPPCSLRFRPPHSPTLSSLSSQRADLRFSCPRGGVGWGTKGGENFQKGLRGRGAANNCCNAGAEEGERRKEDQFFPLLPTPMQLLPNVASSSSPSSSCKQGKEGLLNTTTPTPSSQFLPSPFSPSLRPRSPKGKRKGVEEGCCCCL